MWHLASTDSRVEESGDSRVRWRDLNGGFKNSWLRSLGGALRDAFGGDLKGGATVPLRLQYINCDAEAKNGLSDRY